MAYTILCLASYFKGGAFIQQCKQMGLNVVLVTIDKMKDEAWPRESIDEFFHMPELGKRPDITHAVSYLARSRQIDLIVALDDFDVETAAHLREHFRMPGMGDSLARNFRDKLAMRTSARNAGRLSLVNASIPRPVSSSSAGSPTTKALSARCGPLE